MNLVEKIRTCFERTRLHSRRDQQPRILSRNTRGFPDVNSAFYLISM